MRELSLKVKCQNCREADEFDISGMTVMNEYSSYMDSYLENNDWFTNEDGDDLCSTCYKEYEDELAAKEEGE